MKKTTNNANFYDIVYDKNTKLPKLKKIKKTSFLKDYDYAYSEMVDIMEEDFTLSSLCNEHAYIIAMDNGNRIKGIGLVSVGTNMDCDIRPRTVGSYLLLFGAERFVLMHNHPNGIYMPSESDYVLSANIKNMASVYDIEFLDHITVSDKGWYAMNMKHDHKN